MKKIYENSLKHSHRTKKIIWFTGLSGSGKTTLANLLKIWLLQFNEKVILLDGDEIRLGLNKNLGFALEDRIENVRRVAELSKIFLNEGYDVVVSMITPLNVMHESNENILKDAYIDIFVNTPLSVCKERDPKGLYLLALNNKIKNVSGIDSPFELKTFPSIEVATEKMTKKHTFDLVIEKIRLTRK